VNVAELIHDARLRAGLTQAELADRSGTSQATISAYEHGAKTPTPETLARVLGAAGVRLTAVPASSPVRVPGAAELDRRSRVLAHRAPAGQARADAALPAPPRTHPSLSVTLAEKLLELHAGFESAGIPHAFGGAIALAYWTLEPRGTRDIDVNLFVPAADSAPALQALPKGVAHDERTAEAIVHDGQVRVWWADTPVDLFFSYEPVHAEAARNRRMVPFEGEEIPILGPVELAVFKAMFNRTRHWADIEAMLAAGNLDADAVRDRLASLVGAGDERITRLDEALRAP
jgi:transcriptional regulator with XRE-family HTH domain